MQGGLYTLSAVDYARLFKRLGVSGVIRLNTPVYDRNAFLNEGIQHYDLFLKMVQFQVRTCCQNFFRLLKETNHLQFIAKPG